MRVHRRVNWRPLRIHHVLPVAMRGLKGRIRRTVDPAQGMLLALFILNSFVCAALLFWLQPMFARMVLPLLGGSPSVWITAMMFYQAALLAGYAYAHGTLKLLGVRRQAWLHLGLLIVPFLFLPIVVPQGWTPPAEADPRLWLIGLLALAIGVPFFVLSTSSPVLQRWFSTTSHGTAPDPYVLYAASNAGSVLALLSYPLWLEPNLTLDQQSQWWSRGYALAVGFSVLCAVVAIRHSTRAAAPIPAGEQMPTTPPGNPEVRPLSGACSRHVESSGLEPSGPEGVQPTWRLRGLWLLLAFIPCSLMLSTTTFVTTDLASVPLLWIIPLTLYLVSFILVFSRLQLVPQRFTLRAFAIFACAMTIVLTTRSTEPLILIMPISLLTFFLAAMACHHGLAATRPAPQYLTEFYLCLSVGGLLGGIFNALIAPWLFTQIAELPIGLTLACVFGLLGTDRARYLAIQRADFLVPVGIGCLAALFLLGTQPFLQTEQPETRALIRALLLGIPMVLCFLASRRPVRFGLGLGAILLVGYWSDVGAGRVIYAERSFYGVHRVTVDREGRFHRLLHGHTFHGLQSLDPAGRGDPLAYYHRNGPIGHVFAANPRFNNDRIAVVGLGVGSLAAYGRPPEHWDFYEIDPAVERIARDTRLFTFLQNSAASIDVILGDARLSLQKAPDHAYGLIVLDAYSSDAIPVHLLTREAVQLYRSKLAPGGLLAFHISNLHLDLAPVIAALARDAGWLHRLRDDVFASQKEIAEGVLPSRWMLMAESEQGFASLQNDLRWEQVPAAETTRVWTDSHSSLMEVLHWRPTLLPHWLPGHYR
jgi:spermidine synthase